MHGIDGGPLDERSEASGLRYAGQGLISVTRFPLLYRDGGKRSRETPELQHTIRASANPSRRGRPSRQMTPPRIVTAPPSNIVSALTPNLFQSSPL